MRKVDFELDFKKDLSNIEIEGIESIVENFISNTEEVYGIDHELYFIYTSSSSYAMHSLDNRFYCDGDGGESLEISHFAITTSNMLIMVCTDEDENYHYYEIEPSDF